jgi:hypothetical protein
MLTLQMIGVMFNSPSLTASAVPEPSTYALIAGLAGILICCDPSPLIKLAYWLKSYLKKKSQ